MCAFYSVAFEQVSMRAKARRENEKRDVQRVGKKTREKNTARNI